MLWSWCICCRAARHAGQRPSLTGPPQRAQARCSQLMGVLPAVRAVDLERSTALLAGFRLDCAIDDSRLPARGLDSRSSGGPPVQALRLSSISDIAVMVL